MTVSANVVDTANNNFYQLREHWLQYGPPPSVWPMMSPFLLKMRKGQIKNTWKGKTTGRLPVRDQLPTGGGANFQRAFENHNPMSGSEFAVPIREHWQHYISTWLNLQVMADDGLIGNDDVQGQLVKVAEAFWIQLSYLIMEDGTGRLAKGDGAWTITGDTIIFLNRRNAFRFEENDILVFTPFDEAITSGDMATPRAYTGVGNGPKVLEVNEELGTVKTDQADLSAVITGLTFNDYIGKHSMFASQNGAIDGVFRWVPFTNTEAATTLYGVNRGKRVSRLSGKRVLVNAADSPALIVSELLKRVPELNRGGKMTGTGSICVPAEEGGNLALELASMGYSVLNAKDSSDFDPLTLSMGLAGVQVNLNGLLLDIVPDLWLADKELPATEDRTYLLTLDNAWHIETTKDGANWQNRGRGILERVDGSQNDFSAPYGCAGNLYPDAVGDNLLATTRAND